MSSSSLVLLLLCAPIVGQTHAHLSATVGGSVMIPCLLPVNSTTINWFYWQEDGTEKLLFSWLKNKGPQPVDDEYKNRVHAFKTEFNSGNISIRLNNVSVGDDNKTFWANVEFYDEHKKVSNQLQHHCRSSLQISAAYQDLNLTINNTLNSATCTAHGGYPKAEVKWTGQNKSSSEQLDLQDAQTSLQQHPTKKTFTVTSTISIKELQSVTCNVSNPRSKQLMMKTTVIDAPGEDLLRNCAIIVVSTGVAVILLLLLVSLPVYFVYRRRKKSGEEPQQAPNQEGQESNQQPQPEENEGHLAAGGVPADGNPPGASSNSDVSEENVLLDNQALSCSFSAANNASKKDIATADREEKTNLLSDRKDDSGETKSSESDKDK